MFHDKGMSKKQSLYLHCKDRFRRRFNIELDKRLHNEIVNDIISKKCNLVEKQSQKRFIYSIIVNGDEMLVVYDRVRQCLITCLYPDELNDKAYYTHPMSKFFEERFEGATI